MGCGLDVGMGVQLKKGNFLYSAVSIPQKNVSTYKVSHCNLCCAAPFGTYRESYLTTKQGGNIENNGISISLEQ